MDDVTLQKQQLRNQLRRVRQELDRRDERSASIVRRMWELPEMAAAQTIAFYWNVRSEVVTRSAIEEAWDRGLRIALPYCVERGLRFAQVREIAALERGTWGVMEPVESMRAVHPVDLKEIDVIITPGLAFDRRGGRLGYGRGHYDNTLSRKRVDCIAAGLAFDCQVVDTVPSEAHDQRVDVVVTESAVYRVEATRSHG